MCSLPSVAGGAAEVGGGAEKRVLGSLRCCMEGGVGWREGVSGCHRSLVKGHSLKGLQSYEQTHAEKENKAKDGAGSFQERQSHLRQNQPGSGPPSQAIIFIF